MLRFLVDENVRREVRDFLIAGGHEVTRPTPGTPDDEVAAMARETSHIILTHDKGFSDIFAFPPRVYAGIVVIRILPPSANLVCFALGRLLAAVPEREFAGRLFIAERVSGMKSGCFSFPSERWQQRSIPRGLPRLCTSDTSSDNTSGLAPRTFILEAHGFRVYKESD